MSSRELGGDFFESQKPTKHFSELSPSLGNTAPAREKSSGSMPLQKEKEEKPFDGDVVAKSSISRERSNQGEKKSSNAGPQKESATTSEDKRPEAVTGGGGDKPPIDRSSSHAGAEFPDQGPKRDLEGVMHYIFGAQAAEVKMLNEALEEEGTVTFSLFPQPKESLIECDEHAGVKGTLEFDQGLVKTQYHETLDHAGLKVGGDIFSPTLLVTDGEQFTSALSSISEGSEMLNKGLENATERVFKTIQNAHVTDTDKYIPPTFTPRIKNDKYLLREYNEATAEMLKHGDAIAEQLDRLGVKDTTVSRLKAAHTANQEGMLPEWAMADHWDLYRPATTHFEDTYWTQFYPSDWGKVNEFFEKAIAKAPKDSQFIKELTTTMQTNIEKLRNGILAPTHRDSEPDERFQNRPQQSDALMASLAQKLQKFAQGEEYGK